MSISKQVFESINESYLEYERNVRADFEHIIYTHGVLYKELTSLLSQIPSVDRLDLRNQIYEFKMKLNDIEQIITTIQQQQQQLQDNSNERKENLQNQSMTIASIERLKKDIDGLQLKFDEINNYYQKNMQAEKKDITNINTPLDNNKYKASKSSILKYPIQSLIGTLKHYIYQKPNETPLISQLLLKQISPTMLELNENDLPPTADTQNQPDLETTSNEETIVVLNPSTSTPKTTKKIHLSNNIIRFIRGPFKVVLDNTMQAVDVYTEEIHTSEFILRAVQQGLLKQNQSGIEKSLKPAFGEITSDWQFESINSNQGLSSRSIWMRNPQGRRILVKTQDHPLSAANEWLVYILGRKLGLPVNEAQIAVYKNLLVTLHTDVARDHEQTIPFMNLPKKKRKLLLKEPIIERMDLFDRLTQNVDRNQQNILITLPKTANIKDDSTKLKVHFVDHGACFGMAKLNGISVIASKFHCNELAVIEFDPIEQAKKFELYLSRLPIEDRSLIRKILNRFASITDEQINSWMNEVQDLLINDQFSRIQAVLRRQRTIAKRYIYQWAMDINHAANNNSKHRVTYF